jgi:Na+-translocating ferredoxin:NAD+ oxidoreductase RnfD subunit
MTFRLHDPRLLQIGALTSLLVYGVGWRGLDVQPQFVPAILGAALATQWIGMRRMRLPGFEPRSALISALSVCLLLRADHVGWAIAGAVLSVGSKFVFRLNGKHIFNPTNFGLVALLIVTDRVWVSPGQWGSAPLLALIMAGAGTLVVTRAARADITLGFLAAYACVLGGRALWLGQPITIPQHQMASGALVLFSFFMISDPKTTPDSRTGRLILAALVAAGAGAVQFLLYRPNGLLWSLAAFSIVVPLIDRLLPGARYAWSARTGGAVGPVAPEPGVSVPARRRLRWLPPRRRSSGSPAGAMSIRKAPVPAGPAR